MDYFNLPESCFNDSDIRIYGQGMAATAPPLFTWYKPRGRRFLYIFIMGGGGGGGNGSSNVATAAGGGGGGGAGMTSLLYPMDVIPDQLYVEVGRGGVNAAGIRSTVRWYSDTSAINALILYANGDPGTAALNGGNNSPGTGGGAGAPLATDNLMSVYALMSNYTNGVTGRNGSLTTGTDHAVSTTSQIYSGAGGGAGANAGGGWASLANSPWVTAFPGGAAGNPGAAANSGVVYGQYIGPYGFGGIQTGGAGGGGANPASGTGGRGGRGSWPGGGGGGGGGAGTSGTGGAGGAGADGVVIMHSI